jgi:predicted metalloprotease with PDZ domain
MNNHQLRRYSITFLGCAALFLGVYSASVFGQSQRVRVKITVVQPSSVNVEIEPPGGTQVWSFPNAYAGVLGLGDRVEDFRAIGASGESVNVRKIASGEFRLEKASHRISYVVRIPPGQINEMPHVSWLADQYAFLMLGDLLPEFNELRTGLSIEFELPSQWTVFSATQKERDGKYFVDAPDSQVFFVGRNLRAQSTSVRGMELQFVIQGDWSFSIKEAIKSASKVLEMYSDLTGFRLRKRPVVFVAPFPIAPVSTRWKAETRGSTVSLLMNPQADIRYWTGQLGVIFTHELLHLWVPNSLSLKGNYDWFFEGFTLYIALQTALNRRLIRFQEYLDTLARVYDSYRSYSDDQTLVQASESRWTNPTSIVYDKGMLVAFIYDLMVRRRSRGNKKLSDQYRLLFDRFSDEQGEGNDVIIKLLASSVETAEVVKSYIETSKRLDLESVLQSLGLELVTVGTASVLKIRSNLTNDQESLLRSLGYRK